MIVIPFMNHPYFSENVIIDDVPYTLEFAWNHRGKYWTLNVYNNDKELLIAGVKIVLDFDVLKRYAKVDLPRGVMLAIRNDSQNKGKIEDGEMGSSVDLVYVTEAESASL